MISEEKMNLNFANFIAKLKEYDAYPEKMENDDEFNNLLRYGSAATNKDSGMAYDGSLIETSVKIAVMAYNINSKLPVSVAVPTASLVKVAYLHQISMALMIVPNTTDWELKKGWAYKFRDDNPKIRKGEYTAYLCAKYGIELTEGEYEAILSVDRDDDKQFQFYGSMLSHILSASSNLIKTEYRLKYKL